VQNGATLGGEGTTSNVTVEAGGFLAPGASVGDLTAGGNVEFDSASGIVDLVIELADGQADHLHITGDLVLNNSTTNDRLYVTGSAPLGVYPILTVDGTQFGEFDAFYYNGSPVADPTAPGSFGELKMKFDGNNILLVPEPTTLSVGVLLASAGLLCRRRERT
jgi:hypothetical protein